MIREYHALLQATQFLPPERLRGHQRRLLERLLRHARAQVPFYRDGGRLDVVFRADDSIDWDRWCEIPPLTRADLQQHYAALRAEELGPEHGNTWTNSTSGTTDEPVNILHTDLSGVAAWSAVTLRDYEWHGIDATKRLAYIIPFTREEFDIDSERRHEVWFGGLGAVGLCGERFDFSEYIPADELVERVCRVRPDYIRVQPVTLELMRAHDKARRLPALGLSGIMAVGEYFAPDAREEIADYLGCPIVQIYGSNECMRMATTCADCGRYHVHAETVHIEVVDDAGAPVAPGASGFVLATPLYNYAMPLIRYAHADVAEPGTEDGCRIRLPTLTHITGKRRTPFVFPDGTAIRPSLPNGKVVEYLGARAFQFAQTAPDRCEVRFVAGDLPPERMRFAEMTQYIRALWWHGLDVEYRIVPDIPRRSPRAKRSLYVREA